MRSQRFWRMWPAIEQLECPLLLASGRWLIRTIRQSWIRLAALALDSKDSTLVVITGGIAGKWECLLVGVNGENGILAMVLAIKVKSRSAHRNEVGFVTVFKVNAIKFTVAGIRLRGSRSRLYNMYQLKMIIRIISIYDRVKLIWKRNWNLE